MRGKIILILVGLAALGLIFMFPPDEAQRDDYDYEHRYAGRLAWSLFWAHILFNSHEKRVRRGLSFEVLALVFCIGVSVWIASAVTSIFALKFVGGPMAIGSMFALGMKSWQERKESEGKAEFEQTHERGASLAVETFETIDVSVLLVSGNPELNLMIKESSYDDLVDDLVQPYLSILLAAKPTLQRDTFLKSIYAGVERVMESRDPEAREMVLKGLLLGKGSWWWKTSLPFLGEATQEALEAEVPGWRNLPMAPCPVVFPMRTTLDSRSCLKNKGLLLFSIHGEEIASGYLCACPCRDLLDVPSAILGLYGFQFARCRTHSGAARGSIFCARAYF